MGAAVAEMLAVTSDEALGAVLMHAALPVEAFGVDSWAGSVPVQVHFAAEDPLVDHDAVRALHDQVTASGAAFERHTYPGSGHLFADPDLSEYNPSSAELMFSRVSQFLAHCCS